MMRARWPYLFSFAFCATMAALTSFWWLAGAAAVVVGGLRCLVDAGCLWLKPCTD